MIHFDCIEGTELGAESAVHTNIHIDEEFGDFWFRFSIWILGLNHPDTLRRANFCADAAGCATHITVVFFVNQNRQHYEIVQALLVFLQDIEL